eukprot:6492570-Amphidinium_carterae.2
MAIVGLMPVTLVHAECSIAAFVVVFPSVHLGYDVVLVSCHSIHVSSGYPARQRAAAGILTTLACGFRVLDST